MSKEDVKRMFKRIGADIVFVNKPRVDSLRKNLNKYAHAYAVAPRGYRFYHHSAHVVPIAAETNKKLTVEILKKFRPEKLVSCSDKHCVVCKGAVNV